MQHLSRSADEQGFAVFALVAVLMPLLLLVGVCLQTMVARQSRLRLEIRQEQAMLTAESGIDVAIYEARRGTLRAGRGAGYVFDGTIENGSSYHVLCTYLGDDAQDNDGDTAVDEADEDVFRVVSTGTFGASKRRVAVYLGFVSYLPPLAGAMTLSNPRAQVVIGGSTRTDGNNHLLSGALARTNDVFGITMTRPGTLAHLGGELSATEATHVVGSSPTPSIGMSAPIDMPSLFYFARNAASTVITRSSSNGLNYGTRTAPIVTYREGNLDMEGNTHGYGLLVVNGDLRISGGFRWDGVILCSGTLTAGTGNGEVYGAMVMGSASPSVRMGGSFHLYYSVEGIALATSVLGRYVAFNGWQEVSSRD